MNKLKLELLLLGLNINISNGFLSFSIKNNGLKSDVKHSFVVEKVKRSSIAETSDALIGIRSEISKNEDLNLMVEALRGKNLNDDNRAADDVDLQLVDIKTNDDEEVIPLYYDPNALKSIFSKRPMSVARRLLQISNAGWSLALNLVFDKIFQRGKDNPELEIERVKELRDTITRLGPFFIKIGQALSIRPDVLSPRSMVELQKLCDKVPSFDSKEAFETIENELGRPLSELFSDITSEPIAAASLGQVYQATLRSTGEEVAVKVQRPFVLETVSLDLYLVREIGLLVKRIPFLEDRLDTVSLLDEFAFRFYQELDYNLECDNGVKMREQMKCLPNVVVPKNYPEYTSRRVHVAEWIQGEKLSQSTADDVGALVNLGVVTYLTQLLEYGFFHADPHPGNMMRTADGKLAILDFGLMTEITNDQKYGMIEAIAHLLNRDYSEIGQDFINLDFIPKGTDVTPIVPALTKVFDVALAGGGAKSINFQELASDLAQITFQYPFRIPPYFALVIRAISVLEGIALVGNPNFAIIDEAYPYIARRLMTDDSPRLKAALRYMVYGREGEFNAENLIDLLQALEKFTAIKDEGDGSAFKVDGVRGSKKLGSAGEFTGSQKVDTSDRENIEQYRISSSSSEILLKQQEQQDKLTVREALKFFFSPQGSNFRDFILEEIVTVVDASSREAVLELATTLGLKNLPIPSLFKALTPELTSNDKQMIKQIQTLVQFLFGDFEGALSKRVPDLQEESPSRSRLQRAQLLFMNSSANSRLRKLIPIVREYAPQLREFGTLLVLRLSEKSISRGLNWAATNRF